MLRRVGVFVFILTGCHVGTRAKTFAPARDAAGVDVAVALGDRRSLEGELLTVGDTALLLLSERGVVLVPAALVRGVRLAQRSDVLISAHDGKLGPREALDEARLLSRFPQGLTPVLLRRLLAAYGQTDPHGVSR